MLMVVKNWLEYRFCCILCEVFQHKKQQFVEKDFLGYLLFACVALAINKRKNCQGTNGLYALLVELLQKNTTTVVKR